MPLFTTTDELARYIKFTTIKDIHDLTAEYSQQMLEEAIKGTVYSTPRDGWYNRTGAMLRSIGSLKDKLSLSKYTSYVQTYPIAKDMDSKYPSVGSKGRPDNRNKIVEWLNNGHTGIWNYEPQNFIEKAQRRVNTGLVTYLMMMLEKKNYIFPDRVIK